MAADLAGLEAKLDTRFAQPDLLELALTHRSCGSRNNERLEFLGDSILNHIVAEHLYLGFPECSEGELSRMRSSLVNGQVLADVARELDLGDWIRLGPGELKSGGRHRDSILADALEAVLGAILLDAGIDTLRERIISWFDSRLQTVSPESASKDAKTSLQEYLQGRGLPLPDYRLSGVEGAEHCQQFEVECLLGAPSLSVRGRGSSRRRAEQAAAAAALEALDA